MVVTTGSPGSRRFLRNGFNGLFRALPGDEFVLPPSPADSRCCRTRLGRLHLRRLDASNGRQDHTALPYANRLSPKSFNGMCTSAEVLAKAEAAPFVHAPDKCSQAFAQLNACPATPERDDAAASTASHPNVRDDRDTPLVKGMRRRGISR